MTSVKARFILKGSRACIYRSNGKYTRIYGYISWTKMGGSYHKNNSPSYRKTDGYLAYRETGEELGACFCRVKHDRYHKVSPRMNSSYPPVCMGKRDWRCDKYENK